MLTKAVAVAFSALARPIGLGGSFSYVNQLGKAMRVAQQINLEKGAKLSDPQTFSFLATAQFQSLLLDVAFIDVSVGS